MDEARLTLLDADEPPPFTVEHPQGTSPFFLTADHAGKLLPQSLGDLGVSAAERERHIAWDIGIAETSRRLADKLDAFLILQTYSRLVIDCNRAPEVASAMCVVSEATEIPGNRDLTEAQRQMRITGIFKPYHARIAAELDRRKAAAQPTVLIAMHSFTPVYKGLSRPWQIGVLYNRDPSFAHVLRDLLEAEGDLTVGDNQPYFISDESDYGIPVHGERRGLPHVELEIRQDLIAEAHGQEAWAERLARLLPQAYQQLRSTPRHSPAETAR